MDLHAVMGIAGGLLASVRLTNEGDRMKKRETRKMPMMLLILTGAVWGVLSAAAASGGNIPVKALETPFPPGDGKLSIYSYHLDRYHEIVYRRGDSYDPEGLKQIERAFRSRDGKSHPIDLLLIELLDHLQEHFKAETIELISGYRSPKLNERLRKEGVPAGENSYHIEGKAADIHFDEITEEKIEEYARSLAVGGVGYYPAQDFVHVDTGEVRRWSLPDKPGRLFTALRKGALWEVTTDRDLYLPGESIPFSILNITRTPKKRDIPLQLQRFRKGEWVFVKELLPAGSREVGPGKTVPGAWKPDAADPFGKFRMVLPGPEGFPHLEARSNEFYRKRE
jgi:uncharacterized protein YcbK (DUF882 family)